MILTLCSMSAQKATMKTEYVEWGRYNYSDPFTSPYLQINSFAQSVYFFSCFSTFLLIFVFFFPTNCH